jgi:hypothetical protein
MPSDLENSLIEGGISPAAAKLLSNAIGNAATGRLSIGRQLSDATPADRMRLIDSDTRRYVLTNLDYPADNPFRQRVGSTAGQYKPNNKKHPYADSQPASASPTLKTGSVKAGKFMSVAATTADDVAQSEVTLNIKARGGKHARLDPATGEVESVPISVVVEPKEYLEATVEERPEGTVIRIRLKPQEFMRVSGVKQIAIQDSLGQPCGIKQVINGVPQSGFLGTAFLWTG